MSKGLQDKIAVVTGASRGIGRASALALAKAGADLVITSRTENDLNTLAEEIRALGRRALVVVGDNSSEADVQRLYDATRADFGRTDILVCNTGVGKYGPIDSITPAEFDWMMSSNVRSTYLSVRAFYPEMRERKDGTILFIGSVAGTVGIRHQSIYSATKHAQYGIARSLDYEAREFNVKVSYIAPGGVETYFALGMGRNLEDPKMKEYLDAEDVGEAVVFAADQPAKGRIFFIGMRPMRETLGG
ncbi:MAG: SDR family oxidoreductase [Chloroflexi bacterium]|nr:SDR family oxidoreductase [Chloroflexota bacterium]